MLGKLDFPGNNSSTRSSFFLFSNWLFVKGWDLAFAFVPVFRIRPFVCCYGWLSCRVSYGNRVFRHGRSYYDKS